MILDREKAIREALAEPENDLAQHNFEIPEKLLNYVRSLPKEPSLDDAVLHLIYSIATSDPSGVSLALHKNHHELNANLVKASVAFLQKTADEPTALECSAFAHYELHDSSIEATLPVDFDFDAWKMHREANVRVTNAGFARYSGPATPTDNSMAKGYLAQRPWLIELVLEQSNDAKVVVDRWWGLVVPALLNFLDTTDLVVKARGIKLVTLLAQRYGTRLSYAGLTRIFEETVEPCLSFVPPLVEPEQTKLVLRPAVLCLSKLAETEQDQGTVISRMNYVAREGALKPFLYTHENVELTIYLFDTLRVFIDTHLKSLTVIHLSGIVRIFTQVMTDPFIDFSKPLIQAACNAMASAIKWAWPRITTYKNSILLGLTKANALDTECFELLGVSAEEETQLRAKAQELLARRDGS